MKGLAVAPPEIKKNTLQNYNFSVCTYIFRQITYFKIHPAPTRSGNGSYFFKSTYTSCKNFVKSKNKIRKHKIQSVEPNIFKIQVAMDFTMMMIALTAFTATLMASGSLSQRIGIIIIFAVVGIIIFAAAVVARVTEVDAPLIVVTIDNDFQFHFDIYYDAIDTID